MKKLITFCLLLLTNFAVCAQQKPTKEQTVDYIIMIMNDVSIVTNKLCPECSNIRTYNYVNKDAYFKENTLFFTIMEQNIRRENDEIIRSTTSKKEIDFSKVEQVEARPNEGGEIITLKLKETIDGKKVYSYKELYISLADVEKVIKALNYLRKLCGAPEPINFDGN